MESAFLLEKCVFEMPTLKISVLRAFILKYKGNVHLRHKKPSECHFWAFVGDVCRSISESVVDGVESPSSVKDGGVVNCGWVSFHFWERVKLIGI